MILLGSLWGVYRTRSDKVRQSLSPFPKTAPEQPVAAVDNDDDGVTAGRRGLIVWGEPHVKQNWEATPEFLKKWSWAVQGCDDLLASSNRWRLARGEEPLSLPAMEDLSLN
jgi:hypothetical protein